MTLPRSVWAALFALVAAMIGLGLVTPLLREISLELEASSSQTLLLVTGYMVVLGLAMPFSSAVSARAGIKRTLVGALLLNVVCAVGAAVAQHIELIIICRLGWGLGNALFLATVLAAIVEESGPAANRAIRLFEATVGIGIAAGPLAGGLLGAVSWRLAFIGSGLLMAVAGALLFLLLPAREEPAGAIDLRAPFRLLLRPSFLILGVLAVGYNTAFLTMFSFSPFALALPTAETGLVYFGWGLALVLGSLALAAPLQARCGTLRGLAAAVGALAAILVLMAVAADDAAIVAAGVVSCGLVLGVGNTLLTNAFMTAPGAPDSTVTSAAYNFVRNAPPAVAPWLAGKLYEARDLHAPYWLAVAAATVALTAVLAADIRARRSGQESMAGRPHFDPVD